MVGVRLTSIGSQSCWILYRPRKLRQYRGDVSKQWSLSNALGTSSTTGAAFSPVSFLSLLLASSPKANGAPSTTGAPFTFPRLPPLSSAFPSLLNPHHDRRDVVEPAAPVGVGDERIDPFLWPAG